MRQLPTMRRTLSALYLLACVVSICQAWNAPLVKPVPLRADRICRKTGLAFHTQLNCHARSLGRREALAGLLLFLPVAAAQAAIPSQEEYNVGSGTVVRPKTGPKSAQKTFTQPTDADSTLAAVEELQALLASFEAYIQSQAWDNIRGSLQSVPVSGKFVKPDSPGILFTPFLLGSDKKLMAVAGVDKKIASEVEKRRKECALALNELVDFAFTNRVIFFNEEDKKSVAELADQNLEVDLEEASGILQRSRDKLNEMAALLGA